MHRILALLIALLTTAGLVSCAGLRDNAGTFGNADDAASPTIESLPETVELPSTFSLPNDEAPPAEPAPDAAPEPADEHLPAEQPPLLARDTLGQQLATLPIKGRAPKTGYEREQFGQRWSDDVTVEFGHNGCDTRNDILRRDLTDLTFKPRTRDCVVLTGTLQDPYTGTTIAFQRGQQTSQAVQIDHVVALSDAWQKGAQQLDADTRRNFANDPLNLLAVDGPANNQKGDGDAASWLPSNSPFRCQYVARQIAVKHKYQLWVTDAEHQALGRWLNTCTDVDEPHLAALLQGQ